MDLVREKVGVTACTWCRRPHADGCWTDNRLTCCDTRVCAECFITTVDETKRGRVHVPTRRYKTKKQLRKRSDDVKTSFHAFNGRCAHEIIPFARRERYAMMFYCVDGYKGVPEGVKRAPEGVQRALKGVKHRTKNTGYSTSCKQLHTDGLQLNHTHCSHMSQATSLTNPFKTATTVYWHSLVDIAPRIKDGEKKNMHARVMCGNQWNCRGPHHARCSPHVGEVWPCMCMQECCFVCDGNTTYVAHPYCFNNGFTHTTLPTYSTHM